MALINVNHNKIIEILNNFINNEINDNDFDKIINSFNENDFQFYIKTYKYESSINIHTAKRIINFQNSINKIVEYFLKRKLNKNEKENIIIDFSISKGCTEERPEKLLDKIKEILEMIPKEYRFKVLLSILILIGFYFFTLHLDNKLEHEEKMKDKEIISQAIDRLSEDNDKLSSIIKEMDKNNLNELQYNDKVTINGQNFTKDEINNIKNKKYPQEKEKKIGIIKGNFAVIQINIKKHFIIIENEEERMKKIFYNNDLFGQMQSFKEKFKEAIEDEGKIFYIEASFIETNGKKSNLILGKIEEPND